MNTNKDTIRLNTISRDDTLAKNILDSATSTALYSYEEENGQWTKDNVEGTLMIYEREAPPHNMINIINKLNKVNFLEPLTSSCEIQVKPPYLLFKNSKGNIYGIWFNDEKDVHRISSIIKVKIEGEVNSCQSHPPILNDPAVAAARSAGGDIMTMLSLAHGEFESKRHEPSRMVTSVTSSASDLVKPSPLRANEANTTIAVAELFAKAVGAGGGSQTGGGPGRTLHSPSSGVPLNIGGAPSPGTNPVLQKLFQGAAAIGGQASVVSGPGVCGSGTTAPIAIPGAASHSAPHSSNLTGSAPMSLQELEGKLKENLHVNSKTEDPLLHLKHNTGAPPKSADGTSSLLSPQVFTSSHLKDIEPQIKTDLIHPYTNLASSALAVDTKALNGSDEPFNIENALKLQGSITPLTQEQLVQAFTLLLKKDEFVKQLHEAYVQALHKSMKGNI